MKLNRADNAISGTKWGVGYRIIATLFPFVIRTIIIKDFGEDYLGLNSLFTSILQVLNLSELGLSNAIIYSMYKPIAEDDYNALNGLLRLYKKLYFYIGCFILFAGMICMPFLDKLINGEYPSDINIYLLYFIFLINTSISYLFLGYKEALLAAYQRNDILNKVRLIVFSFQFILQCFILIVLKDYYIYAAMMAIATILRNIINYRYSKTLFPDVGQTEGSVDRSIVKEIKTNILGISIGKACTISRGACNSIVISSFISLPALAIFDNYFYIISAIIAFMTIIETSLISGVGNSIVMDTQEKNYSDFKNINFLYMWIVGCSGICLLCLIQPFVNLWVGDKLMLSTLAAILFCVYYVVSSFSSIPSVYCTATGLWWKLKYKSITEVVLNIILSIVFVKLFGVVGVLLSSILTLFLINFCWASYILYKNYFKSYALKEIIYIQLKYFVVIILVAVITYYICTLIRISNPYINLLVLLAVSFIISNLLFYLIYFKEPNMPFLKRIVKKIVSFK